MKNVTVLCSLFARSQICCQISQHPVRNVSYRVKEYLPHPKEDTGITQRRYYHEA